MPDGPPASDRLGSEPKSHNSESDMEVSCQEQHDMRFSRANTGATAGNCEILVQVASSTKGRWRSFAVTEYALNDRGSLELVTEDYYDAEILRLFENYRLDREQVVDSVAHLVPEPDNPHSPDSVAIWVNGHKVARMTQEDSERYWKPLARIVVSGYVPVAPIRYWATLRRDKGQVRLETKAVLSVSRPELLFPINTSPTRAALLPQGPSVKVLNENDHAEYLHDVLPVSGEGRVILTLEANRHKLADGSEVDTVDVLHDRRIVGRLSTQMSEQLAPVVRYAFENNKLTAVWGTIRGSSFELSLTVQAVRAEDLPRSWYLDLPNSLPQLKPKQDYYELDPAFVPSDAEEDPDLRRPPRPGEEPYRAYPSTHGSTAMRGPGSSLGNDSRALLGLGILGALILVLGIVCVFFKPGLGVVAIIVGAVLGLAGLYFGRLRTPARLDEDFTYDEPDDDVDDDELDPADQDVDDVGSSTDDADEDPSLRGSASFEDDEEYLAEDTESFPEDEVEEFDVDEPGTEAYEDDEYAFEENDGYETVGQDQYHATHRDPRD